MSDAIEVVLVDDHEIVREGLRQVLEDVPGFSVVGQAANGDAALEVVGRTSPDVVLLDYSMPGTDASTIIGRLLERSPGIKILVLTMHDSPHYAARAIEAGAHGYVIKSSAVRELVSAIRKVCDGEVYLSPGIAQRILGGLRKPRRNRTGVEALSPKELEVMRALASGMSLKECAAHLDVSLSTASTYRTRLLEKLRLRTTADIIRFALENDVTG